METAYNEKAPMTLKMIRPDVPVWKINNFYLPEVSFENENAIDQGNNQDRYMSSIKDSDKDSFKKAWLENISVIVQHIQDQAKTQLVYDMWLNFLKDLKVDSLPDIFIDRPGFNMGKHIDNRFIIGTVIVNLKDNPKSSGTHFWNSIDEPIPWYSGPVKKHTGILMLNNVNTLHSININKNEEDVRHIAYENICVSDLFKGY